VIVKRSGRGRIAAGRDGERAQGGWLAGWRRRRQSAFT
jgi:hypothetical protein